MSVLARLWRRLHQPGHIDKYGNNPDPFAPRPWEPSEELILW